MAEQWAAFAKDKVQSWDQANANILSVFMIQNFTKNFVSVAILIVAAFGIYNILNILVNQKRKDIGILRSIGYTRSDIVNLFLIHGLVLGIGGGLLGLVSGYLLCNFIETLEIGGMADRMLVSYDPSIYWGGFSMALLASAISSFLPAWEAGKLEPIDIVRSGE